MTSDLSPPKVTVVLPVYNVEPFLRQCLDSVVNQTMREIQIICVNDGSTDGSQAILEEYAARDSRFKIIVKDNGGSSSARNAAFPHIQGEYLLFVDSDDWIDPTLCEKAYAVAEKENADMTYFFMFVGNGRTNFKPFHESHLKNRPIADIDFGILICDKSIYTKLWKSGFILKNGITFPDRLIGQDRVFNWDAMTLNPQLAVVREHLYYYRNNPHSVTSKLTINIDRYQPVYDRIEDILHERNLFEEYSEIFYREKLLYYCHLYSKIWEPKEEKHRAKRMLNDMLKKSAGDYSRYDFTALGFSRGYNFALHCFCRWIQGSRFHGMIYHSMTTAYRAMRLIQKAMVRLTK